MFNDLTVGEVMDPVVEAELEEVAVNLERKEWPLLEPVVPWLSLLSLAKRMIPRLLGVVTEGSLILAEYSGSMSSLYTLFGIVFDLEGGVDGTGVTELVFDVPRGPIAGSSTALSKSKFSVVANLAAIGRRNAGAGTGGGASTGLCAVSTSSTLGFDLFPSLKKRDLDFDLRRGGCLVEVDM
jgi:hypothetical protein